MTDRTPATFTRRAGAGLASLVRGLCGSAAGARRRGSTIVLVVSSLALFAVITVAYVGLGIGDRRTGSVTRATDQVDDVAGKVRDYLVDVIGRDTIAVLVEEGPRNTLRITREAWDYPWTDPMRVSDSRVSSRTIGGQSRPAIRFDPAGTMPRSMVEQARSGRARWGEPFAGSDPWLASTEPCWLPRLTSAGPPWPAPSDPYYLDLTSWWQISNFAPDGRFVNLFALRNNFEASPGIRAGEMSEHLGLLDDRSRAQSGRHNTIHGERADKNVPAHWTMLQEGAARPVGPGMDSSGRLLGPGDAGYALYSWADADGDGILDARWFELVDAYDANSIVSLLPRDSRWRWFVAARAVDLSSLININTARDVSLNGGPGREHPIGLTPADIDALRVMTLEDHFALTVDSGGTPQTTGYGDIHQPVGGGMADYTDYSADFDEADELGRLAYQAIKEGAQSSVVPPAGDPLTPADISAGDREDHYLAAGAANPGGARWDRQRRLINSAAFGIQDLVELLTYHGLNDPDTLSRLERMAGGRDPSSARWRYSPFRDNRPLDVERMGDVGNPASPNPDGQLDPERLALLAMDARRRLTTLSGATQRRSSDVPYSGATDVPLAIASVYADAAPAKAHPRALLDLASARPLATAGQPVDRGPLFSVYASALLPGATAPDVWTRPEYRTMFYGHDPLFALRAAAHLTANRVDSWDNDTGDEQPTALTVLLSGSQRSTVESNPDHFPWWQPGSGGDTPGRIDFEELELGELSTDASFPAAVNVYGIEPQPFLVQAATFTMYTDQHADDGGDREWEQDPIAMRGVVTIEGDVSATNDDFIFQVVAFQLTNPFDEALNLEDYSLEFGRLEYELNKEEDGNPITIQAGETVVVYYLSQDKTTIAQRMQEAAYQPSGSITFDEALVDSWIEFQFKGAGLTTGGGGPGAGSVTVVELQRLQPGMGGLGQIDLLVGSAGDPNVPANRAALLWREIDTPTGAMHRMLIDRLRDPASPTARPTLDQRLDSGENRVAGTDVTPPPSIDDEGMSITLWGSIRRPEDPGASATMPVVPRGGLPAWCIESRFGAGSGGELNVEEAGTNPESLTRPDFATDTSGEPDPTFQPQGELKLESLLADQTGLVGGTPQVLVPTLRLKPEQKQTTGKSYALSTTDQKDQLPHWSSGAPGLDPELHVGSQRSEPLRLADMLMAMAVGPVEDPQDPRYLATLGTSERIEEKWTTLSESLALTLGYDEVEGLPTTIPSASDPVTGPTAFLWHKTDRGFLRLDDYTAFYDGDADGVYDPTTGRDVLVGAGAPMALSILDTFRPSYGANDSEQFGSLTNPAVGVININTAPPPVLRALGILSPTASDILGVPRSWLTGSPHDDQSDIAATFIAYRDKSLAHPRTRAAVSGTPDAVSFMGTGAGATASRGPADPEDILGRAEHVDNERFTAGAPLPVREQPGFRSVGEVMLARDTLFPTTTGYPFPHDIDRLGLTGAMTEEGVESFAYEDLASGERLPDQLDRDYDEKLAVFNSIASSISVRSDLYAVWFVLHGYQREDTEGLGPQDPLIPTVAKRFLIIVDRSNVTTEGERPRILHFQELPL